MEIDEARKIAEERRREKMEERLARCFLNKCFYNVTVYVQSGKGLIFVFSVKRNFEEPNSLQQGDGLSFDISQKRLFPFSYATLKEVNANSQGCTNDLFF